MRTLSIALAALVGFTSIVQADERRTEYQRELQQGREAVEATRLDEAAQAFERALVIMPRDGVAAFEIARVRALQKRTDDAVVWIERAVDWGFGNRPKNMERLEREEALNQVRDDARVKPLLTRARTLRTQVDEYVREPSIYRPKALEGAARANVLIVLHDRGQTREEVVRGPWRQVADELGMVLIAPSGRRALYGRPAEGMTFADDEEDYTTNYRELIHPILSISDFLTKNRLEVDSLILVGDGRSTAVALDTYLNRSEGGTFMDRPGANSGLILCDGPIYEQITRQRLQRHPGQDLRVRYLFAQRTQGAQERGQLETRAQAKRTRLAAMAIPCEVRVIDSRERDVAAWRRAVIESIESLELATASPAGAPR